jgi:hypothetical protein
MISKKEVLALKKYRTSGNYIEWEKIVIFYKIIVQ